MKVGKKTKTLVAFALFVGFGFFDINLHAGGLFVGCVIVAGLAVWLRKWRDGLEFYRRLKRATYTIGFLTMIAGILWTMHEIDNLGFEFMVSLLMTLFGLLVYVKRKHRIVEFHDLTEQRKQHENFTMSNYSVFPFNLYVDWVLKKHKNAQAGNELAEAQFRRDIGKSRPQIILERLFPILFFVGFAIFMLVLAK